MAAITPVQITETGTVDLVFTAAAVAGDTIAHYPTLLVVCNNASGGAITVTIAEQMTPNTVTDSRYGNLSKSNATLVVGAGKIGVFGPFKAAGFKNSSGNIVLTYSSHIGLSIAGIYI